jgi:hypothetical protein
MAIAIGGSTPLRIVRVMRELCPPVRIELARIAVLHVGKYLLARRSKTHRSLTTREGKMRKNRRDVEASNSSAKIQRMSKDFSPTIRYLSAGTKG